jgi:LacI family transcriptional regulator
MQSEHWIPWRQGRNRGAGKRSRPGGSSAAVNPMKKTATMADVARLANVGTMTVSRVLNGSAPVHPETAEKVHRAIETLNYRPNEAARTLRGHKSRSIGLIVPSLADPFFATCAHSINAVAQENGYSTILTTSNGDPDVEYSEAEWMLRRTIEGLIIVPAQNCNSRLSARHFDSTPIVAFDTPIDIKRIDCVLVENEAGSQRATQHLIDHGHRLIHFLGHFSKLYTIQTRLEGYRRAVAAAGLEPLVTLDCASLETVSRAVRTSLESKTPPTAFFCANNLMTKFLMRSLFDLGLRVPDQIAVVGFDDFEMADVLQPTMTVVRQMAEEMGTIAASVLFERLKMKMEERPRQGTRKILPVELIIRTSCGCRPATQPNHHRPGRKRRPI